MLTKTQRKETQTGEREISKWWGRKSSQRGRERMEATHQMREKECVLEKTYEKGIRITRYES